MDEFWEGALKELKERIGRQNFDTWIKPIRAREPTRGEFLLEVPNKFFRDWVAEHFLTEIRETLAFVSRQTVKVTLSVNQELQPQPEVEKREDKERARPKRFNNLMPKYNFENFVVGARTSSSGRATSSPMRPHSPSPTSPVSTTTRSSSTAVSA